jgi:hypothetical protein
MIRAIARVAIVLLLAVGCTRGGGATVPLAADGSPTPMPRPLPPVARSSADVKDPVFHVGQEVFITDQGFVPLQLVAIVGEKISFINETDASAAVEFTALDFESGPIAPGRRATFTPDGAYSIGFHLSDDPKVTGAIQVQPYFQPGEDPAAEDRLDADTPGESPGR